MSNVRICQFTGGVDFHGDAVGPTAALKRGMPVGYDPGRPLRNRIEVEFVEADVEIGFNLVDLAGQEFQSGHSSVATRVLRDADDVLQDIERRLSRLGNADRECFRPLIEELRREVNVAKSRASTA